MPDALGPAPRIVVGTLDAMQAMPRRNIVVISPHLDDAVLDCGDQIRSWLDCANRTTAWSRRQRTERLVMANGRHLPLENESFDVGVDMRKGSPTFGQWQGVDLSDSNRRQFYLPPGTAHGLRMLRDVAEISYKSTADYAPGAEYVPRWDDPDVGIDWPLSSPLLSDRDRNGRSFADLPYFEYETLAASVARWKLAIDP